MSNLKIHSLDFSPQQKRNNQKQFVDDISFVLGKEGVAKDRKQIAVKIYEKLFKDKI